MGQPGWLENATGLSAEQLRRGGKSKVLATAAGIADALHFATDTLPSVEKPEPGAF